MGNTLLTQERNVPLALLTCKINFTPLPKDQWDDYLLEGAEIDGKVYRRVAGNPTIHIKRGDYFECVTCGTPTSRRRVQHPIKGRSDIHIEYVPYCSNCEDIPSQFGKQIN